MRKSSTLAVDVNPFTERLTTNVAIANKIPRNVESLNKTLHIGAQGSLTAVN